MQKHDAKNAQGTSGTQQPNQKKGVNDLDATKKQGQKQGDRNIQSDDDFNSPQRNK
jgi:hypothetical protein